MLQNGLYYLELHGNSLGVSTVQLDDDTRSRSFTFSAYRSRTRG